MMMLLTSSFFEFQTCRPPEMPWRTPQDFVAENYMMSPAPYNPYWNGTQPGMEGFMGPYGYGGGNVPPYMGFRGPSPFDMPFAPLVLPQDSFARPGYMFPPFGPRSQRDLAEYAMGLNAGPPLMSREEFEAMKAGLQRKRQFERPHIQFLFNEKSLVDFCCSVLIFLGNKLFK